MTGSPVRLLSLGPLSTHMCEAEALDDFVGFVTEKPSSEEGMACVCLFTAPLFQLGKENLHRRQL